jgi:hypothetical protein
MGTRTELAMIWRLIGVVWLMAAGMCGGVAVSVMYKAPGQYAERAAELGLPQAQAERGVRARQGAAHRNLVIVSLVYVGVYWMIDRKRRKILEGSGSE